MTHTCPHPACTTLVNSSMLACRPHWLALPKHLRAEVWAAWQAMTGADPATRQRHRAAVTACLAWWRTHA